MDITNKPDVVSIMIHNVSNHPNPNTLRIVLDTYDVINLPLYRVPSEFSYLFNRCCANSHFHAMMSMMPLIMEDCVNNMPARLATLEKYYGISKTAPEAVARHMYYESPLRFLNESEEVLKKQSDSSEDLVLMSMFYSISQKKISTIMSMFIEWYCVLFGITDKVKHDFYTDIFTRRVIGNNDRRS